MRFQKTILPITGAAVVGAVGLIQVGRPELAARPSQ